MLLFYDSFDHYTDFPDKEWSLGTKGKDPTIAAEGRTDSCAKWVVLANTSPERMTITPLRSSSTASGVCGFAFKCSVVGNTGGTNSQNTLFAIQQSGYTYLYCRLNTDGTIGLLRRNGISYDLLQTSSGGLVSDVWAYLEFKWVCADSGTFDVWKDGTNILR